MPEPIRILFIGEIHSSHAIGWMNLLSGYSDLFEIRAVQLGLAPAPRLSSQIYCTGQLSNISKIIIEDLFPIESRLKDLILMSNCYLPWEKIKQDRQTIINALRDFKPQLVHTFGFDPSALIYALIPMSIRNSARWVLQTRGGSDVAFNRIRPAWQELFRIILPQADSVVCDNDENYRIFFNLGIKVKRSEVLPRACGGGGIDLSVFGCPLPVNERERLIVWNKAYESPWSKGLPVLEAIRIAYPRIAPVRFIFTAVQNEIMDWIELLPEEIRISIDVRERISHAEMLALMLQARIVLAPSLVDGIPNTLYETMAAGAIPIVSPLETLLPYFKEEENVFYARNLYPNEVAEAIVKAFNSNDLPAIVHRNRRKVLEMADRRILQEQVSRVYKDLAEQGGDPSRSYFNKTFNISLMKLLFFYLKIFKRWLRHRIRCQ